MLRDKASKIIEIIENNGFEAYMVGGCVRDFLMGRQADDIDITTNALPNELEEMLSGEGIKYIETGIKHGTVTALFDGDSFEITTYRSDGDYNDNRHPDNVEFVKCIDEDLARRDFTINAIAYNKKRGIVDLFGGRDDIEKGIIRAVGDADKRFNEDALRIMRAIRFSSVLGFKLEESTKKAVLDNKALLKNVSSERIFSELIKLLMGKNVFNVLMEYKEVLAVVIPEITACFSCEQRTRWHIYDVWEHTCKAVECVKNDEVLRLIMLFHDIGKPYRKTTDLYGVNHFKGHQAVSSEMTATALKRLKASNEVYDRIMLIIPIHDAHIGTDKKNIKKWLSKLSEQGLKDLLEVQKADKLAQNPLMTKTELERLEITEAELDRIIEEGEPFTVKELDIDGNDIISLGFEGRKIGLILGDLLDRVIEEELENKREILLEYVKKAWQ